jgi:acetyl-CoA carboxylase biotin carboxyl carrier protein
MDSNEMKELRELIEFLKANEIAEFDLEKDGLKVRLTFAGQTPAAAPPPGPSSYDMARLMSAFQPQTPSGQYTAAPGQPAEIHAAAAPAAPAPVEDKNHIVKSPIVGTFYESPSPGAPAFVKVGDTVEVGQILCIVEAMKLMNEIEADAAGVIVERIAQSGQPVEYGQPLFSIKAS